MYRKSIGINLKGMKPGTKLFLIRWLSKFGNNSVDKTVIGIAKELDVTDRVVSESISFLVNGGYFSKEKQSSDKQGRPSYSYRCIDSFTQAINKNKNAPGFAFHKALVDNLLTANKRENINFKLDSASEVARVFWGDDVNVSPNENPHCLSNTTKLLLIILFSFADECGVVRKLGFSDISKFTGMDRDRIKRQIKKLQDSHYLLNYIAGVTGQYLFGIAKGVFFLNIDHELFKENRKRACLFNCVILDRGGYWNHEAYEIFKIANPIKNQTNKVLNEEDLQFYSDFFNYSVKEMEKLIGAFKEERTKLLVPYFQIKLNEYASYLLSNHWEDVQKGICMPEGFIGYLKKESLLSSRLKNAEKAGDESSTLSSILIKFIAQIVIKMARDIQTVMLFVPENVYSSMNHIILSDINELSSSTKKIEVKSYCKLDESSKSCRVVNFRLYPLQRLPISMEIDGMKINIEMTVSKLKEMDGYGIHANHSMKWITNLGSLSASN